MATVVKSKRKRKRGYDSGDEMNATDTIITTPPDSPEDSLIEVGFCLMYFLLITKSY